MQAKAEYGGRLARCPACGENVLIPAATNGSADVRTRVDRSTTVAKNTPPPPPPPRDDEDEDIPTLEEINEFEDLDEARPSKGRSGRNGDDDFEEEDEGPRKRRASREDDDDVDEEDARPGKRPSRNVKKLQKSGGRMWLWVSLAAGLLLVLGGGGALAWWLVGRGSGPTDDLVYIPGNVQGFVSIRLGALSTTPLWPKMVAMMPPQARADMVNSSVPPADTERLTIVFLNIQAVNQEDAMWAVVRTTKPLVKEDVFKSMGDTYSERTDSSGKTYYVPSQPKNNALWFPSDKICVFGRAGPLERARQLPATRTPGPLDAALDDLKSGRHFVAAFVPPPELVQQARANPAPQAREFQALLDATLVKLVADVGDGVSLDLSATFPDDAKAKAAKDAVDKSLAQAKQMMNMFAGMAPKPKGGGPDPMAKATALLNDLKVDQNGTALSMKVALDGETVSTMSSMASSMAGPMPGGPPRGQPALGQQALPKGAIGKQGIPQPPPTPPTGAPKRMRPPRPAPSTGKQ
jgi:hypothetical protein